MSELLMKYFSLSTIVLDRANCDNAVGPIRRTKRWKPEIAVKSGWTTGFEKLQLKVL